ncbi:MAG TPA: VanZ family protein [Longimicrobium sp.]
MRRFDLRSAAPLLLTLAVTLGATLWPEHGRPYAVTWCIACGERGMADAMRNVLLFIPLGFFVSPRVRHAAVAVAACAALSLAVEAAQQWIPGRDPSAGDLLLNTAGAALGMGLARSRRVWLHPSPRAAAWLAAGWAALLWAVFVGTGRLLAPVPPRVVTPGPSTGALMRELFAGRMTLDGVATHGVRGPVALAALPGGGGDFLGLRSEGDDLVLWVHTRAAAIELDRPDVRWRGALRGTAMGPVPVSLGRRGGGWCIRAGPRRNCGVGPTAGSGWGMIVYPDALARRFGAWIDAAWVMALFAPFGLWIGRRGWVLGGMAMGFAALAVLPLAGVLAPTPPLLWLGAIGGMAFAAAARRFLVPNRRHGEAAERKRSGEPLLPASPVFPR